MQRREKLHNKVYFVDPVGWKENKSKKRKCSKDNEAVLIRLIIIMYKLIEIVNLNCI